MKSSQNKAEISVRHAYDQFEELIKLPFLDAEKAAQSLKDSEIHREALVRAMIYGDLQGARERLRSHFYVNRVIDVHKLFKYASRTIRTYLIEPIELSKRSKQVEKQSDAAFKGISKALETQPLTVEMDLMLKNILAAHAPTAAKERSSLQAVSI